MCLFTDGFIILYLNKNARWQRQCENNQVLEAALRKRILVAVRKSKSKEYKCIEGESLVKQRGRGGWA